MMFPDSVKRRNDGDISLNSMIVLSLLLHALLISIIVFSPSIPTRKWTFGPVYSVDLVSLPTYLVEKKEVSSISKEVAGLSSRDNTVALKRDVKKTSPFPIERITTRKRDIREVDRAIEGVKTRVLSSSEVSRETSEMSMKMRVYYSVIWSKIKGEWAIPGGILPDENIGAVVSAKVLGSGEVVNLNFEKRSGNRYFDESAMRAIKKASPFPPLPEWMKGKSIEVGIRFHSSELQ